MTLTYPTATDSETVLTKLAWAILCPLTVRFSPALNVPLTVLNAALFVLIHKILPENPPVWVAVAPATKFEGIVGDPVKITTWSISVTVSGASSNLKVLDPVSVPVNSASPAEAVYV